MTLLCAWRDTRTIKQNHPPQSDRGGSGQQRLSCSQTSFLPPCSTPPWPPPHCQTLSQPCECHAMCRWYEYLFDGAIIGALPKNVGSDVIHLFPSNSSGRIFSSSKIGVGSVAVASPGVKWYLARTVPKSDPQSSIGRWSEHEGCSLPIGIPSTSSQNILPRSDSR